MDKEYAKRIAESLDLIYKELKKMNAPEPIKVDTGLRGSNYKDIQAGERVTIE